MSDCASGHYGYMCEKDSYLARLKRIEGQARGIHRMIEEEQYCIDILTQISAMKSALENVALGLMDDHLKHCVLDAAREISTGAYNEPGPLALKKSRRLRQRFNGSSNPKPPPVKFPETSLDFPYMCR